MSDAAETVEPETTTLFALTGEWNGVRAIVDRFYDLMDSDSQYAELRAMHAPDLGPMRVRLTDFLAAWLGGPRNYFEKPGHNCVVSAHKPFAIGEKERDQWTACMHRAMADCEVPEELREFLDKAFVKVAEAFRNR